MTAILSTAMMLLITGGLSAQTTPNFAGEWKIDDSAAPDGAGRSGAPGPDLTITQTAGALTIQDMKAPRAVKLTYKLDGSLSKNVVAGRSGASTEQVSKAIWAGHKLVVTTTTGAGEEKRTYSMDGDYLVVDTSAPSRNGGAPNVTKVTYKEYIRGFGG
jgi:hypothetical protein